MGENLYKKSSDELIKVYPKVKGVDVVMEDDRSLPDTLNDFNHLFLEYIKGSKAQTRLQVPREKRKRGLYVTYVGAENTPVTEQYIGKECGDEEFILNKNWIKTQVQLDENGKITSSYLPSYVDDVLEFDNMDMFPPIGESSKIYVNLEDNKTYRWSGTQYIEISKSLVLGTESGNAFPGDRGARLEDRITKAENSLDTLKENVGTIDGKLDKALLRVLYVMDPDPAYTFQLSEEQLAHNKEIVDDILGILENNPEYIEPLILKVISYDGKVKTTISQFDNIGQTSMGNSIYNDSCILTNLVLSDNRSTEASLTFSSFKTYNYKLTSYYGNGLPIVAISKGIAYNSILDNEAVVVNYRDKENGVNRIMGASMNLVYNIKTDYDSFKDSSLLKDNEHDEQITVIKEDIKDLSVINNLDA